MTEKNPSKKNVEVGGHEISFKDPYVVESWPFPEGGSEDEFSETDSMFQNEKDEFIEPERLLKDEEVE